MGKENDAAENSRREVAEKTHDDDDGNGVNEGVRGDAGDDGNDKRVGGDAGNDGGDENSNEQSSSVSTSHRRRPHCFGEGEIPATRDGYREGVETVEKVHQWHESRVS